MPNGPTPDGMDAEQRALYDAILGGPRRAAVDALVADDGSLKGPFGPMLLSPPVGHPLQELGAALRFGSSLVDAVRELAILVVANACGSTFEWHAHRPLAEKAGVPSELIEAISDGVPNDGGDLLTVVRTAAEELTRDRALSRATAEQLDHLLDDRAKFELIALCGYYALLASLMSVFEIG